MNFHEDVVKSSHTATFLVEELNRLKKTEGVHQKELTRLAEEARNILLDLRVIMKRNEM